MPGSGCARAERPALRGRGLPASPTLLFRDPLRRQVPRMTLETRPRSDPAASSLGSKRKHSHLQRNTCLRSCRPAVLLIIAKVKGLRRSQPRVHRGAGRPRPPGRSGRTSTPPPRNAPRQGGSCHRPLRAVNGAELGLEQGSLWGPDGAWLVETRTPRRTERLGFGEP